MDRLQADTESWGNRVEDPEMMEDEDGNIISTDPQTILHKLQEKRKKVKNLD